MGNREDTVIITVDDDCLYSMNLVESLVRCAWKKDVKVLLSPSCTPDEVSYLLACPVLDLHPLLSHNRHLPEDGGAIGGFCEEPPPPGSTSETGWRQMHEHYLYRNMYRGFAVECQGWLMGFGGIAYRASSFNDSLLTFLVSGGVHEAAHKSARKPVDA